MVEYKNTELVKNRVELWLPGVGDGGIEEMFKGTNSQLVDKYVLEV